MKQLKDMLPYKNDEVAIKLIQAESIFYEIYENCGKTFDSGCGSYLFDGSTYEYFIDLYPKQKLLYELAKESSSVLELGTYMGHSALIMLLANPKLKLTTIDIMAHLSYPATETLKKHFPEADIQFIHGNSLDVLTTINDSFDLFHIDGDHDADHVIRDFDLCKQLSSTNQYKVIFDDWHGERGPGSSVEKHVLQSGNVSQYFIPNCLWTNSYIQMDL